MFNLTKEVKRLYQLRHDKIHGLPYKRKPKNSKVNHVDGTTFNGEATQEGVAISKGFKNRSVDFGRRLSKAKGQYHKPGGGFAGHIIKGG